MSTSLFAAKLYFPPARQNLVPRSRLVERLDLGLKGTLTLISAPAGSGKTTLMGEWRVSLKSDVPVAWLSLDPADNDPLRFLTYLSASIETVSPGSMRHTFDLLRSFQVPAIEALVSSFIESLNSITDDVIMALDDYHVITNLQIHETLINVVNHLPASLHLVILSRADPPIPLARLRARNQLTEIRASDLRFTLDETEAFLSQTMELSLSADNIKSLEMRTEGWIVGLQLAALSMQGKADMDGFIKTFTGSNRFVLDYLAEEVLQQQPENVRTFLLQTSILNRLTGPLCDVVTGQQDGEHMLVELERRNLFIIPLDMERRWYRYHHLLTDLLLSHRKLAPEDSLRRSYLQASEWCAQQDLLEEAIHYALAAPDYAKAAELIEKNAWAWLNRGQVSTVLNWIAALPEEQISIHPKLGVVQVWAMFVSSQEDKLVTRLQSLEKSLSLQTSGEETLLRAIIARWQGKNKESLGLIEQAVGQLDESQLLLHSQAWFHRGMLYRETDIPKAQQAFGRSSAISLSQNDVLAALKTFYFEGVMFRLQGALHRSAVVFRRALELSNDRPFHNGAGYAHLGMAELTYEWNDLEATTQHLNEAFRLAQVGKLDELHFNVALAMVRVHRIRGEWVEAQQMLGQAEELAYQAVQSAQMRVHSFLTIPVLQEQVCLGLAQGEKERVFGILESPSFNENLPLYYRQMQQMTHAHIALMQEKRSEALLILDRMIKQAEEVRMVAPSAKLLRALTYFADGEIESALMDVETVLALAEQEGHMRVFLDEGEPMINLLRRAASKGIHPSYVKRLLQVMAPVDGGIKRNQALIEPLSEREMEVLRLIAEGLSNQEIADKFTLSIGTVKAHTASIYRKINVTSRTQAISRARELNLL